MQNLVQNASHRVKDIDLKSNLELVQTLNDYYQRKKDHSQPVIMKDKIKVKLFY